MSFINKRLICIYFETERWSTKKQPDKFYKPLITPLRSIMRMYEMPEFEE